MRYLIYIGTGLVMAAFFETLANTVGEGLITTHPAWPILFVLWYGLLYSVAYFLLHKRPLWQSIIVWAIAGVLLEIIVFNRSTLIIDAIVYAVMGFVPRWVITTDFVKHRLKKA